MNDKPKFLIIGGDCRFSYLDKQLIEKGFESQRIYPGDYKADDFTDKDVIVLPVPVSRDSININAPLSDELFYFGDFLRLVPSGCIVAGGLFTQEHKEKLENKNVTVFDYYKNDGLTIMNAVPTAEGVIGLLINSLPVTINNLKCAVTGYGRCGSVICRKLKSLGADVTCVARSEKNLTEAVNDGIKTCRINDFKNMCHEFEAIINTVPSLVINSGIIRNLKKECLIIEIASAPFGVDFDSAKSHGINIIKAGSLPGRTAPETAGKIICKTILSFYGGGENGN